jgi:MoxR-like ATPase
VVTQVSEALRLPAETKYSVELAKLAQDSGPRPAGWALSARAVRRFIIGDEKAGMDRAIVSLMSNQGLMLVGEPGTAKSMLSELLAAAISGRSTLVVQGSAGTTEDHIRYSWNYALLLAEGPSERALVPSPVLTAMRSGTIIRFEEITRCPPEVQDALISIMSEKTLAIPELGAGNTDNAQMGFNVIGTANLRDRGVHEMSSALKRRFNFETVHPISDPNFERELILKQLAERLEGVAVTIRGEAEIAELLVQTFQDLRTGRTREGISLNRPDAVMSTAEAVNVLHAAALEAAFLDNGTITGGHVARQIQGVILKDAPEDGKRFKAYVDHIIKERAGKSGPWRDFYQSARTLKLG